MNIEVIVECASNEAESSRECRKRKFEMTSEQAFVKADFARAGEVSAVHGGRDYGILDLHAIRAIRIGFVLNGFDDELA